MIGRPRGRSADPNHNGKLRDVIAKAKPPTSAGDNIMRSIKKAAGEGEGASYKEITYEGVRPQRRGLYRRVRQPTT